MSSYAHGWGSITNYKERIVWLLARVNNFIGGGEYPTLYTAAKHTALSYDAICYWHLKW